MGRRKRLLGLAGLALVLAIGVPLAMAQREHESGFEGHIQNGTCADPKDDVRVDLKSHRSNDVNPYLTEDADEPLAYYGAALAPGFALAAAYDDEEFSLVITDPETGDEVACGDILQAHGDRYRQAGIAFVQLLPVEGAHVYGSALIQRTPLQRELDITPTVVRILLSRGAPPSGPDQPAAGYDGYVQGGTCDSPTDKLTVDLDGNGGHDVKPYVADLPSGGHATLAYYGAPGVPGFGLAAAYTDEEFSLVITDDNGDPAACGDIRKADLDDFREAGLAVVELSPVGDSGVQGYAVIERTVLQRELDITPTRARILLFAPPAT